MKKIKKLIGLLFFALLLLGIPALVKAETNISIENLEVSDKKYKPDTIEQNGNVFIAEISGNEAWCKNTSLNFDINVSDTNRYKITEISNTLQDTYYGKLPNILSEPEAISDSCYRVTQSINLSGMLEGDFLPFFLYYGIDSVYTEMFHFTVKDTEDNSEKEYFLIVDSYSKEHNYDYPSQSHISSIELYNGEDNSAIYGTDESGAVVSYGFTSSSLESHVRKLKVENSSVKLMLQQNTIEKKYQYDNTLSNHSYISWGENYVIVNGGQPFRVDSSVLEKENGLYLSRKIPLKKGINVIQILTKDKVVNYEVNRGLDLHKNMQKRGQEYCYGYTYIIENSGKEGKPDTSSSDATIREADANSAAYGNTAADSSKLNEYTVGLKKGTEEDPHILALPMNFLENPSSTDVILGLKLANAEADWKLSNSSFQNGEKFGNYVCIRAGEIYNNNGKFAVQVINEDGDILGLQHFQIELVSSDCELETLSVESGSSLEEGKADAKTYLYHVEKGTSKNVTMCAEISDGAQLSVNNQPCESLKFEITEFTRPTCLTITAADKVTKQNYYIIYKENGTDLYFTPSEEAKTQAKTLLKTWENRTDRDKKNMVANGYWGTFMTAATSTSSNNISVDGSVALDVFRGIKDNADQATTTAAVILELVIQGENPYDYEGTNYVEKLKKYGESGSYGPYANNIWALMAYRAAGEAPEETLTTIVKNQAMSSSFNLDMRAWALSVAYDYMTEWEVFRAVENIRKTQVISTEERSYYTPTEAEIGMFMCDEYHIVNSMTHGCTLSALVDVGVDIISQFTVQLSDGSITDPMEVLKNFQSDDGTFKYSLSTHSSSFSKDIIIGLGSVAYGEGKSVFSKYAMTDTQYNDLLKIASEVKLDGVDAEKRVAFETAYQAANTAPSTTELERGTFVTGSGKLYWDLYSAIADIDPALVKKPNVRYCTMAQSDQVDAINETIETLKKVESKDRAGYIQYAKAISDAKTTYDKLGTDDKDYVSENEIGNVELIPRLQSYVKDYEVLTAAYELIKGDLSAIEAVITAIDDLAEPATLAKKAEVEAAYAKYEALTAEQKTAITNLDKLEGLRRDIANIEAAIAAIKALPSASQITLSDQAKVDAAQKAYDALTDELKKEVTNAADLTNAQARLTDLKAADAVTQQIAAIGTITETNWRVQEPVVAAAKDSYNRLSAAQKGMVANLSVLEAAEKAVASFKTEASDKEAADVIIKQIEQIGEITKENWSQKETQVAAVRAAYDRLTAAQKNLVTNLSALEAAENTVKEYKANAAADNGVPQIIELIQALRGTAAVSGNQAQEGPLALTEKNNNTPTWEIWTDEWIQYVTDIRSRIRQLEPGLESTVTNLADLEAAEKYISQLQVGKVSGLIAALPNADTIANYQEAAEGKTELIAEQLTAILEAKAAYDNLTPEQKQAIDAAAAANLEALYAKAQTYPDSRTLYLQAYLQPYVDSLAYYYQRYQQEGLDRSGLASVREALGKCDEFNEEERAVLDTMNGQVNGEAVPFGKLFSFLDEQAGQVQKDINDAAEADARIAALPDEITKENVNEVDQEIAAIEQMLDQMSWSAKSYMKNQGRLGVLKALVDYYLSGDEVRQAFEAGSPELVSAKALAANSVQISWMSYDGAGSYLVLRKTAKGNWKQIAEVTELAYTDDSAKQGTTYTYTVQARSKRWNGESFSSYNTEGLSVTTPVGKLTRPSWKNVQSAGYQSVKLSWHKVSGASGYEVSRAASKNGKYQKIKNLTKTSYTDQGLTTGKTYYYKVRAYRTGKKKTYGAYSAPIAGTPRLAKVTLSQTKGVKRAVQLKWKRVNGATGYKVYRAASKNGTFKAIKTLKKGTSFKDTGVTPKKTYYYRVCAYRTVKGKTTTGSRSDIGKAAAK